eukprot:3326749-Rhodomonas_salina.5
MASCSGDPGHRKMIKPAAPGRAQVSPLPQARQPGLAAPHCNSTRGQSAPKTHRQARDEPPKT